MPKPSNVKNHVEAEIRAFRDGLVAWREEAGLARATVVKDIGISPQQLCHIENDTGKPSLEVFLALRYVMGLPGIIHNQPKK